MPEISTFLPAALLASLFVGMSKGGLPMVGMLAVPLLAFYIDPLTAAALLLPIFLVSDVYGIWLYRRNYSSRNLRILIPAGLMGVFVGYLLVPHLSVAKLNLVVGLIGVSFCLKMWFFTARTAEPRPAKVGPGLFWGTITGFTSYVTHAGAPPYQVYILPQKLPKLKFAGTTTILFGIVNFAKLPPYLALGQFPEFEFGPTLALIAAAMFGAWAGSKVTWFLPEKLFFRVVQAALFILCVQLVWKGLTA